MKEKYLELISSLEEELEKLYKSYSVDSEKVNSYTICIFDLQMGDLIDSLKKYIETIKDPIYFSETEKLFLNQAILNTDLNDYMITNQERINLIKKVCEL